MNNATLISEPIVVPERFNVGQGSDENERKLKVESLLNDEERFITAVTYLDTKKPIDEKTLGRYSALVKDVMRKMNKSLNDKLNYEDFKQALELASVIVLESRAMALFNATALDNSKTINCTELEITFMINDSYPQHASYISYYEMFSSFDLDKCGSLNFKQFVECVNAISFEEGSESENVAYLGHLFRKAVPGKRIDYNTFVRVWSNNLANVRHVLDRRRLLERKHANGSTHAKRRISKFFTFVLRHFQLKDILQQEMRKPGYDVITHFGAARQKIVELRVELQMTKDSKKRASKDSSRKQKRVGFVSASQRKKDMSLILRSEGDKTQLMMEENRMMREKLFRDCENEKNNVELMNRRMKHEKMMREAEEVHRTSADRIILSDKGLDEVPVSLYSDQGSQMKLADVKIFDLSGNQLTYIPQSNFLFHLISVRSLSLSKNQLKDIPPEISAMKKIEILKIDQNKLSRLPPQIKELDSIQILDLSANKLRELQEEICYLVNLKLLNLHSNQMQKLPQPIGNLRFLRSIDLSNNNLRNLPDSFCSLGNLVKVNLSKNNLLDLPLDFGSLQNIEDLDLSFNDIQKLPDSMVRLQNLKFINVDHNSLMEVGNWIGGLTNLLNFDGKNNKTSRLSKHLGSLTFLTRLTLPANQLQALPVEIGLLQSLLHLNLHNNLISKLPVEVGALKRLCTLDLSNNNLSLLPHELCLVNSLIWVDLSNNDFDTLPDYFGSLFNLRVLNLAKNKLRGLPKTFYRLRNIEEVDLSSNHLHEIDPGFCEGLVSLREVNFESNRIQHLPNQISTMPALEILNLRHNRLGSLPLDLLKTRIQIDISHNPMKDLPFKFHSTVDRRQAYQNPSGYTEEEVTKWMIEEESLYNPAVDEWKIKKALYISGKLTYSDFISGIIWRCHNFYPSKDTSLWTDDERIMKRIKQFYFHCKKYGNPPLYVHISNGESCQRENEAKTLSKTREEKLEIVRSIDLKRRAEEFEVYLGDMHKRCKDAEERFQEVQDKRKEEKKIETRKLLDDVTSRLRRKDELRVEREVAEKIALAEETHKLNALSFEAVTNKKRFLPVEVKVPCWKLGDVDEEYNGVIV